jgi:hypothetical protein
MIMEDIITLCEQRLVPPMDALGKELMKDGAPPREAFIGMATQLILQARFLLKLAGGSEFESSILYYHADKAAVGDK